MATAGAGYGHNHSRQGRTYAIAIDFDMDVLQGVQNALKINAGDEIRNYLATCGFEHEFDNLFVGNEMINAVTCVLTARSLAKKYPWFTPSVRDLRMLRIEENNDLKSALINDEE